MLDAVVARLEAVASMIRREGAVAMAGPYSIKFEPNLPLMLRDGTFTYVDVFRPDAAGAFPGLLQRTPYDKSSPGSRGGFLDAVHAAMRGYAVVIQDVRGRHSSGGEFVPFVDEMSDGHDSVEWVAGQPWCNGRVGMYGSSYVRGDAVAHGQRRAGLAGLHRPWAYCL